MRRLDETLELGETLGKGSMGTVIQALHRPSGKMVAVKFFEADGDPELRARFLQEGRLMKSLDSPHIVQVMEVHEDDLRCALVCELVDGGTLGRKMESGALPVDETVDLAIQILTGLDVIHRAGIVHRDLKPDNILLTKGGEAKIADLGIAKDYASDGAATQAGTIIGTPRYMAPEQVKGDRVGTSADLYAVGTILYEMLSGQRPLDAADLRSLIALKETTDAPPLASVAPHVPAALSALVDRTLSRAQSDRPPTAADLAQRLAAAIAGPKASSLLPATTALTSHCPAGDDVPDGASRPWLATDLFPVSTKASPLETAWARPLDHPLMRVRPGSLAGLRFSPLAAAVSLLTLGLGGLALLWWLLHRGP